MDILVTRQPVFDIHKNLFAYQLLYQETAPYCDKCNDRTATRLLSAIFLTDDIEKIAGQKPCFINFTTNLLTREIAQAFPKQRVIINIPNVPSPTPDILDACSSLSRQGYILAIDDFVYTEESLPLVQLANIISINYQRSTPDQIRQIRIRLAEYHLKYLAKNIEHYEELTLAGNLGFNYFQGYFFATPEPLQITEVAPGKASLLQLLAEVNNEKLTTARLEEIIATDAVLTFKLLRYINSAFFYLLKEVESVRQAITYLGEKEVRRFVTLILVSELTENKPRELMRLSIVRARFCELIAMQCPQDVSPSELFLLGLFSLIDAIIDIPMVEAMDKLPLNEAIKDSLILGEGVYQPFLGIVTAYEQGNWQLCLAAGKKLEIDCAKLPKLYLEALQFAGNLT
ncbi:MAG: HDOD domain-containing protein [Desulfobulbus sp.]|nr:HDOD domain-containing protein [Desulfobulbus sp.]